MTDNIEKKVNTNDDQQPKNLWEKTKQYAHGCVDSKNARLYGDFQERAALNITQFPKIQGSLLIRMGMVYPIASWAVERMGIPTDATSEIAGIAINYHTWLAGYLAYVAEIQAGLSKYPIEWVGKGLSKLRGLFSSS